MPLMTGVLNSASLKENIAVLDFKLNNVSSDSGNIIRNNIEYNLFKTKKFNLLERNRIDIIRKEQSLAGDDSGSKEYAYKAGMLLTADYVVTGDITYKEKIHLNIVIVDTSDGSIVYSFNRNYKSETELIENSDKIASIISEEILFEREFDVNIDNSIQPSVFFLNTGASYIFKTGKLSGIADNGYMIILNTGIRNLLLNGIKLGLHTGYAHLYTSGEINYISIAPFLGSFSYELQPYRKYFINIGSGFGTAQVSVDINENVERAFETCGFIYFEIKYHIKSDLAFILNASRYRVFENDGNIDLTTIGGGFETLF